MDDLQARGSYLKNEAGKGDKPRNCFSQNFRDNYDLIDWSKNKKDVKADDHVQHQDKI